MSASVKSSAAGARIDELLCLCINSHDEVCAAFASSKTAAASLVKAMKLNQDSAALQKKCCKLVTGLAFDNETNRVRLIDAGAACAVVCAMMMKDRKQHSSSSMQWRGCAALVNLACVQSLTRKHAVAVQQGAILAVTNAMKSFPVDPAIQMNACYVIYNLIVATKSSRCRNIISEELMAMIIDKALEYEAEVLLAQARWTFRDSSEYRMIVETAGAVMSHLVMRRPKHDAI